MRTVHTLVMLVCFLCYIEVPFSSAASLSTLTVYPDITEAVSDEEPLSADKRGGRGVDAWSICPPHMTDVDCFYAYLRVYARLRKAAEKSDRVSMRNIGKRGDPAMPVASPLSESDRARRKLQLVKLCPEGLSPAQCFKLAKRVYQQVLASLRDAATRTTMAEAGEEI